MNVVWGMLVVTLGVGCGSALGFVKVFFGDWDGTLRKERRGTAWRVLVEVDPFEGTLHWKNVGPSGHR